MKKIAITLIAVSALGLAACNRGAGNNTTNDVNSSGPAVEDTNGAMGDMRDNANGIDANGAEAAPAAPAEAAPANGSDSDGNGAAGEENK